jgi:hypothetical protein
MGASLKAEWSYLPVDRPISTAGECQRAGRLFAGKSEILVSDHRQPCLDGQALTHTIGLTVFNLGDADAGFSEQLYSGSSSRQKTAWGGV